MEKKRSNDSHARNFYAPGEKGDDLRSGLSPQRLSKGHVGPSNARRVVLGMRPRPPPKESRSGYSDASSAQSEDTIGGWDPIAKDAEEGPRKSPPPSPTLAKRKGRPGRPSKEAIVIEDSPAPESPVKQRRTKPKPRPRARKDDDDLDSRNASERKSKPRSPKHKATDDDPPPPKTPLRAAPAPYPMSPPDHEESDDQSDASSSGIARDRDGDDDVMEVDAPPKKDEKKSFPLALTPQKPQSPVKAKPFPMSGSQLASQSNRRPSPEVESYRNAGRDPSSDEEPSPSTQRSSTSSKRGGHSDVEDITDQRKVKRPKRDLQVYVIIISALPLVIFLRLITGRSSPSRSDLNHVRLVV